MSRNLKVVRELMKTRDACHKKYYFLPPSLGRKKKVNLQKPGIHSVQTSVYPSSGFIKLFHFDTSTLSIHIHIHKWRVYMLLLNHL